MAKRVNDPPEEDESWMTTYADAITLLMAFFVMLVSFSKIDLPKFEEAMAGIKDKLGAEEAPKRPLFNLSQNLNTILERVQIDQQEVQTGFDEAGVVIEFASQSFFKPGSAELLPQAEQILIEISYQLEQPPYDLYYVDVEGHTDDSPINTPEFPSNWELSTARATGVVRYLIGVGSQPDRMKASGYADVKPKYPNRDLFGEVIPGNREKNRRITIRLHP
ncbi:MAG: flagellar motor protein MotB [Proteobacteria bacterium]|jgi:chemotaxis protein MotB|nr:flagellar motor protein MotB [Pseudomonadota bacterium]